MNGMPQSVLVVVLVILVLALSIVMQVFRTRRSPLGIVVSIFNDIKYNEKLCEDAEQRRIAEKLKTGAWEKNKEKIGFLPGELREELIKLFEMVTEINANMAYAAKSGPAGYFSTPNTDKLKTRLTACREQLRKWVTANMNDPRYQPKKFGLFQR